MQARSEGAEEWRVIVTPVGNLHDLISEPLILLLRNSDVAVVDVILPVSVESSTDEDQVWLEEHHRRQDLGHRAQQSGFEGSRSETMPMEVVGGASGNQS